MKTTILAFLLSLCASLGLNAAVEVDGIYYTLDDIGKTAIVVRNDGTEYSGDIVIPSEIEFDAVSYKVTSIGRNAFRDCTGLTSIEFPESLTSIGSRAFQGCTGLTSIRLPESLTRIEDGAFKNCAGLTSMKFPKSLTRIEREAFYGCTELVSIICPIKRPPFIGINTFDPEAYETATLYVPKGSKKKYRTHWGIFINIEEKGL